MVSLNVRFQLLLVVFGILAVGGLILRAQALHSVNPESLPQSGITQVDTLPEGSAKPLIVRECTGCHVLSKTTEARKDAFGWRGNVKDMIRLGAKLRPEEETAVVAYLSKHFGRSPTTASIAANQDGRGTSSGMVGMSRPGTSPAHLLPDDEGKALILATCVQCHATLGYVLELRKDAEGWKRTVDDMVARGAQVTEEEAEVITNYLTKYMSGAKKGE